MRGGWSGIPVAVGAIDGTSHKLQRPRTEPQEQYYSGHRHMHCMHTVVIIDTNNAIRYVHSGFHGHYNDTQCVAMLPSIGPGQELDFPANSYLLADQAYKTGHPIMSPYRKLQIRRQNAEEKTRRKNININIIMQSYRIYVEHVNKELIHTVSLAAPTDTHD
jgi:hypothetical protein